MWLLGQKKSRKYGRDRKFQLEQFDELLLHATRFFLLSFADLSAACKFHADGARATCLGKQPISVIMLFPTNVTLGHIRIRSPFMGSGVLSSHAIPTAQGCNPSRIDSPQCFRPPRCCLQAILEGNPSPAEHSGALARINSLSAIVPWPD